MIDLYSDVITLVKSAITGEKYNLSKDIDLETIFKIAKRHSVVPMIYYGALNCGVDSSDENMHKMFLETCAHIVYNESQMWATNNLFEAFDKENIAYIPLKGTILKPLYPKSEMRSMGDVDILIKTNEHGKIKTVMQELGYSLKVESDHEFIWVKGNIHIELHKRLIPSYNKDYYAYYGDGWRLVKCGENSKYYMDDEDQMIYIFTHFAKHYRDAGIGIKHILDLWVYKSNVKGLNNDYIMVELKKLQLDVFYKNVMDTLEVWFNNGNSTEQTDLITQIIFNSGVYGTYKAKVLSNAVKSSKNIGTAKKTKFIRVLIAIFLPYNQMVSQYKILKKIPILLPIMWMVRWFKAAFIKKNTIKRKTQELKIMSTKSITNYQEALNFVGLDFNFKE